MMPEQLSNAIALIKKGNKEDARLLLTQITQAEPQNVLAWMWLVEALPDDSQRLTALQECLRYNPQDSQARKALAFFQGRMELSGSSRSSQPAVPPTESHPPADVHQEAQVLSSQEMDELSKIDQQASPFASQFEEPAASPLSRQEMTPVPSSQDGVKPFLPGTDIEAESVSLREEILGQKKGREPVRSAPNKIAKPAEKAPISTAEQAKSEESIQTGQKRAGMRRIIALWAILSVILIIVLLLIAYIWLGIGRHSPAGMFGPF